jgi:hypothetical protein
MLKNLHGVSVIPEDLRMQYLLLLYSHLLGKMFSFTTPLNGTPIVE